MKKIFFNSVDGTKLCGVWHYPEIKTDKVIILAHGITVDKDELGIFIQLANTLCDNGFVVFRFDFRGSGESDGKSIDITINKEIEDLTAAVNFVCKFYKRIGILGASFGGGIAALYVEKNQDKIFTLCLWNPVLDYNHCFLNPTTEWLKNRNIKMFDDIKAKDWTTIGSRNFIVGKKLFDEMVDKFPGKKLQKIKIPTIILHGDHDTHVPYTDSKIYSNNFCDLVTIKGSDHGFQKPPFNQIAIDNTLAFFVKNL